MRRLNSALRWRWQRWRELSPAERRAFITAWSMLPTVALSLRVLGYGRTYDLLGRGGFDSHRALASTPSAATEVSEMVRLAVQYSLIHPTCLVRSLVLWKLLRQRGIESGLRIGVRMRDRHMQAHAWVERDGVVLNDVSDIGQQYAAFDRVLLPTGVDWR